MSRSEETPPVQVTIVIRLKAAGGVRPAHHFAGTLEVNVFVTEDGTVSSLFSADETAPPA